MVLDTTEVNPRYLEPGSAEQAAGEAFVRAAAAEGRSDVKPWGGGVGPVQLAWLADELRAAEGAGERVLVASHMALCPMAARPGRGGIEKKHSSDVESKNRVRASVCSFTQKVS